MKSLTPAITTLLCLVMACHAEQSAQTADFVIVGAGTAGCALAGRLCTRLPEASIILLERGVPRRPESEFLVRTPRNAINLWNDLSIVERYDSEPNPGLLGRSQGIITGKTLGGSSSINGMQWSVPIDNTIDKWRIAGLSSRNWKKYLRRVYRTVGFAPPPKPLRPIYTRDYIRAAQCAGFPKDRKPFSDRRRNAVWVNRLAATKRGRRVDSCTAYVSPVVNNSCSHNLRVIQSATVSRVLLDGQSPPRAYGIEFVDSREKNSKTRKILASKEVLVAAGPYESPKLLQLSGIGPRKVLEKANVPLRVDLAVGTRSQARVISTITSVYTGVPVDPASNDTLANSAVERQKWEQGDFSVLGVSPSGVNGIMKKRGYFVGFFVPSVPSQGINFPILGSGCLVNAKSFGHVQIRDNSPFSTPSVQLNLLGQKLDLRNTIFCLRRLRSINAQFSPSFGLVELSPAVDPLSETVVRNTSGHSFHFVGGCSVGTTVSSNLKVKGIKGLRVIDSSIFKFMPVSAGPMVSTYVLAEFMAERLSKIYGTYRGS